MNPIDPEILKFLASKYIWWKKPDEAVTMPRRVISQVMNIGDYADVQALANQFGDETLRDVLIHAEAGQFNERSWAYWHYRLTLLTRAFSRQCPNRNSNDLYIQALHGYSSTCATVALMISFQATARNLSS